MYSRLFPLTKNIVFILYSYIFNPKEKQFTKKITKKVKVVDNTKEMVIEEVFLLDNTKTNIISLASTRMDMFQAMKDNIINITRDIYEYEENIELKIYWSIYKVKIGINPQ